MSIESVMPSTHSASIIPFSSCLQSIPASGSFPISWLFPSGDQSIGASASVLPMSIQDWFPLGWTGWTSLQSKGLSRVLQHHNSKALTLQHSAFFMVQLSKPYMTNGKTIMQLCWQSDVSAFLICCLGWSWLFFQGASAAKKGPSSQPYGPF